MKTISLKIDEAIFKETENIVAAVQKPRNRYINEAIDYYNQIHRRKMIENKLKMESLMVKEDSMQVLKEFEGLDDEY
jgi:low affinity Fe/Cu permease